MKKEGFSIFVNRNHIFFIYIFLLELFNKTINNLKISKKTNKQSFILTLIQKSIIKCKKIEIIIFSL